MIERFNPEGNQLLLIVSIASVINPGCDSAILTASMLL